MIIMINRLSNKSVNESYYDIKVSLLLFKENWKPFIQITLVTILSMILLYYLSSIMLFFQNPRIFIMSGSENYTYQLQFIKTTHISIDYVSPLSFSVIIAILSFLTIALLLLCNSLMFSSFNLANDIINSGDQFTEFKKGIAYFRQNIDIYFSISIVLFYLLLILGTSMFFNLLPGKIIEESNNFLNQDQYLFLLPIILTVITFLISLLLVPFILSGNFHRALNAAQILILNHTTRTLLTIGMFLLMMIIPQYFLYMIVNSIFNIIQYPNPMIKMLFETLPSLFITYPLLSLIITRMYVTINKNAQV